MKNLFKKETRYSETNRPDINSIVLFSPVKNLVEDLFIPLVRKVKFLIKPKTACKVLRNNKYTTTILVDNKTFIASPMFLTSKNLTLEGKLILEALREKSNK